MARITCHIFSATNTTLWQVYTLSFTSTLNQRVLILLVRRVVEKRKSSAHCQQLPACHTPLFLRSSVLARSLGPSLLWPLERTAQEPLASTRVTWITFKKFWKPNYEIVPMAQRFFFLFFNVICVTAVSSLGKICAHSTLVVCHAMACFYCYLLAPRILFL